ncbi:ankyrin repeat domain-containing protein [Sphingomonas bacterium]|uniref:ankyrin repeat domain-containing protein n=1 Tax=Sphingomonas bacterium TaxID=1895847 RepID=UPI002609BC52|nr:ankyrin repeat domain-containing protein [Sphingomonas bacterium]
MRLPWPLLLLLVVTPAAMLPSLGSAATQGDPFDNARFHVVNKQNAQALAIVDSGAFGIDQANDEGWTLLHFAAEQGNLEMVKLLLARGADPTLKTTRGSTPYQVASATMVRAEIDKAVRAKTGVAASPAAKLPAKTAAARASSVPGVKPAATSPRAKLCQARWYSSQALCSDSTCKMREYRKWQTCQKTGSYY